MHMHVGKGVAPVRARSRCHVDKRAKVVPADEIVVEVDVLVEKR